ncbi:hypothetical protein BDV24DRAFT_166404 [Aspergillus arachidicola]|uniref:HNH nuclease domain-containing protein n=1 Tax=Aspergillus arachidicola TaxID=656916 RepID=A0A5N6Y3S6_9EURO|nr:hypothetical protein BDV24DRAFT_166404 [Aspergillus arachidicola]
MASLQPASVLLLLLADLDNECWNEPSDIRTGVLQRLKAICQEKLGRDKSPPTFRAFCQVADIPKLEKMIKKTESVDSDIAQLILEPTILFCTSIINRWLQRISFTKSSNPGTSHPECSDTATLNVGNIFINPLEFADGSTVQEARQSPVHSNGMGVTEAAHIYPNGLLKASTREPDAVERFWYIMKVFWDDDRVQRWKSGDFCDGRFALRPMQIDDSRTIKVQLFWQKGLSNPLARVDLLMKPESSRGLYGCKGHSLAVFTGTYKENGEPIYRAIASGDAFTISTNDPETMPLPSQALPEMQWYLQRIAGMGGAAEMVEGNSDYDGAVQRTRRIYDWLGISPR